MLYLENDQLRVEIDTKGAELKQVFHKRHAIEYMWDANPAYWAKTSPVLFPIVGALKNNTYQYQGKSYQLPRHGFAREKEFNVVEHSDNALTLSIESDADTLNVYPFHFIFSIQYTLDNDTLVVSYFVRTTQNEGLFFSVGGHPAFKIPLVEGTSYDDYKLVFEKDETTGTWPISKEGLIEKMPLPLLHDTNVLPLKKELFSKDALVFKNLQSHFIQLESDKTTHGFWFHFSGFPYLGLWAAPGADFVCIEPWCGIADSVDSNQKLTDKEGILHVAPGEEFRAAWNVHFY